MKKLLNTATKTEIEAVKTASKKLVHKTVEVAGEFLENRIAEKFVKLKLFYEIRKFGELL